MQFNINEYTPEVYQPQYRKTDYGLELEMALLQNKNQKQDQALQTINQMQNTALNISMLNLEGKQRLDKYNKEISEKLSGDIGDLTDIQNQNKIADLFQKVASDSELIQASRLSREYQQEFDNIKSMKDSGRKDSGYNPINEYVWMNDEGGYYDFMTKSLSQATSSQYRPAKYVPFKDLRTPLANMVKLLQEDIYQTEQQVLDDKGQPTGYISKNLIGGVSPDRVRALYEEQLGADGIAQLEVMSKYDILRAKELDNLDGLYSQYNSYYNSSVDTFNIMKKETEQKINYYEEKLKDATLKPDEITEISTLLGQYKRNLNVYNSNLDNLTQGFKSREDFQKMSNNELLPYVYQVKREENIKDAVNALSYKKEAQSLKADMTYLAARKIDAMMVSLKIREEGAANRIKLSYSLKESYSQSTKGKGAGDDPIYSVGDVSKNEANLLSSYDRLNGLHSEYSKKTDNILLAPSFDQSSLKADKWKSFYEKTKDNYYVQMWDVFKNTHSQAYDSNGNPQLETFRLWLQDKESNPDILTSGLIEQQKKDNYITDYLTSELEFINGTIRKNTPVSEEFLKYARTEDGQQMTSEMFYEGKTPYFFVPTSPKKTGETDSEYRARGGNYQKKTLEELLYDLENEQTYSDGSFARYDDPNVSRFDSQRRKNVLEGSKSSYLNNDPGFKQVLKGYQKATIDPILLKNLEDRLVQYQQYGYAQVENKEEIERYAAQITAAAKNQSDNFRTLFSAQGIEAIAFPMGVGKKGIVKFKADYAKTLNEAGVKLPTGDGNEMSTIEAGKAYLWDAPVYQGRDPLLNLAVTKIPYVDKYKGFTIEIKSLENGNKVVKITTPSGQIIPPTAGGSASKDIEEILSQTRMFVDNYSSIPKQ